MLTLRNRNGFGLLPIILIIGLVGITGIALFFTKPESYSVLPTSIVNSQNPSPTPDVYKGWKTYIGHSEKFSFKYPGSLFIKELDDFDRSQGIEIRLINTDSSMGLIGFITTKSRTTNLFEHVQTKHHESSFPDKKIYKNSTSSYTYVEASGQSFYGEIKEWNIELSETEVLTIQGSYNTANDMTAESSLSIIDKILESIEI